MRIPLNSLRVRIALLVLLVFLPVFALVLVSAEQQQQAARDRAEANAFALAQVVGADNQQTIESARQLITTISRLDIVKQKNVAACNRFFSSFADDLPMYPNIYLVDTADGLNICAAAPPPQPVYNTQFAWYQDVLRTRASVVSEYRIGPVSGKPIVTVAVPVFDDQGNFTAVLAVGVSLEWLNASLSLTNVPSQGTVTLIDRSGTVLARYPASEGVIGQPYPNTRIMQRVLSDPPGTIQGTDVGGTLRLYGYVNLGPTAGNISVVVSLPESAALADATATRNRSLLAVAGITIFVIALGWVSSGVVVRPIQNLTAASRELARGRLNSRTHLQAEIVELQELLDAFNEMAASVENNILERVDELATANEKLEREIDERAKAQGRARILQELTASLSLAATSDEVSHVIVDRGLAALGASRIAIAVRKGDEPVLKILRETGLDPDMVFDYLEMPFDSHLPLADAFRTGEPVWLASQEEYAARYPELYEAFDDAAPHAATLVCLPLNLGDRSIGSLGISFFTPRELDDEFRGLLLAISDYCAQALERARLFEEELHARHAAEAATTRIARLHAVTAKLADALTEGEVGRIVAEQGAVVLGASIGTFHLVVAGGTSVRMISHLGNGKLDTSEVAEWEQYPLKPGLPVPDAILRKAIVAFDSADEVAREYPAMADYATLYPGGFIVLPVLLRGEVVAAMSFSFAQSQVFDDEDRSFMVALTHQTAMALERARLAQLARETAVIQERQRLARDLHDAVSQTLFSSTLIAEALVRQWKINPQKAVERLEQLIILNRGAMAEMRALLFELRPEALEKTELKELLTQLVDAAKGRKRVSAELLFQGESPPLPPEVHITFYRIAQESINNIVKHSKATKFRIELGHNDSKLTMSISDNGQGFDTTVSTAGIGLGSMQERADAIGAVLEVASTPGHGTQVTVRWLRAPAVASPEAAQMPLP